MRVELGLSESPAVGAWCGPGSRSEVQLCKAESRSKSSGKLILQRPEQLQLFLLLHKQRCGFHSSEPGGARASAARPGPGQARPGLLHHPASVWRRKQDRLQHKATPQFVHSVSFQALLRLFFFFFLVRAAEACAESVRSEAGSLPSSDNDT